MLTLVTEVFYRINYYLQIFLPPVAIIPGLFGNICCLLVFTLSPLRSLKASPYLIGLSVAHFGALSCLALVWSERFGLHVINRPGWCQTIDFVHCVCNFLSIMFVFCFTLERYLSFCCRPGVRFRCVQQRPSLVTVIIVALTCIYNSVLFWSRISKDQGNRYHCEYRIWLRLSPRLTTKYMLSLSVFVEVILAVVILILDIIIMMKIARKMRSKGTGSGHQLNGFATRSLHSVGSGSDDNISIGTAGDIMGGDTTGTRNPGTLPRPLRVIKSRQLRRSRSLLSIRSKINATRMLFAASITFFVMQAPFIGVQVYGAVGFFMQPASHQGLSGVGFNIAVTLYVISFALSFFVYLIFGKNFRDAVLMLVTCQYGRICARCKRSGKRGRSTERSKPEEVDVAGVLPETSSCTAVSDVDKTSGPGIHDDVSRYIDDVSHADQTALKVQPESSASHKRRGQSGSYI